VFELPLTGGGTFSLQEALRDSAVVLAFFKVSCPVCQYAFPLYERLSRTTADGRVKVIGVSQDDEAVTRKFAESYGVTFPIALDDSNRYLVSNAYGLTNVPTLFEIAQDGQIAASIVGWEKAAVEDIYRRYATNAHEKPMPLFPPAEAVADFKAG
jgi:peroxiredoxin